MAHDTTDSMKVTEECLELLRGLFNRGYISGASQPDLVADLMTAAAVILNKCAVASSIILETDAVPRLIDDAAEVAKGMDIKDISNITDGRPH